MTVLELLNMDLREHDALFLQCIAGRQGLLREITIPDLNRPGLTLSGFFENFALDRIQVFGLGEISFLKKIFSNDNYKHHIQHLHDFFEAGIPCAVLTHSMEPSTEMFDLAESSKTPLLQTSLSTSEFSSRVMRTLSKNFARHAIEHGVLVEVFGIGILITGNSGVGKSESALELLHRGHRLVADDSVQIKNVAGNVLIGSPSKALLGHHMEIRGLGIINIAKLFGVGAIRENKQIQLIVDLELWDSNKEYERLGTNERTREILEISVPYLLVPVKPGRNIPIIIETAAMNERLKKMGHYSAKEINQTTHFWMQHKSAKL